MNLQRFGQLVRMLASPNDNEVVGAARALQRMLKENNRDLNDFAKWIEDSNLMRRASVHHTVVVHHYNTKQERNNKSEQARYDRKI